MASKKLLNQVLKRFNSLLFLTPEEKEQRLGQIQKATPDGLAELLKVFEEAHSKQKKYLQILCESDPEFAKSFYVMMKEGEAHARAGAKLKGFRKKIKSQKSKIKNNELPS